MEWVVAGLLTLILIGMFVVSHQLKEIYGELREARLILQRLLEREGGTK